MAAKESNMSEAKRGVCYVFANFVPERNKPNRLLNRTHSHIRFTHLLKGSLADIQNIKNFFEKKLSFEVKVHTNLSKEKFINSVQDISKDMQNNQEYDSLVAFILTHGTKNGLSMCIDNTGNIETDPITGKDIVIPYDEIRNYFSPSQLHINKMEGKPRIIFVNACRGHGCEETYALGSAPGANHANEDPSPGIISIVEDVESIDNSTDTSTERISNIIKKPTASNMLIVYSTLPGDPAYGDSHRGSWFIEDLLGVIEEYYDKENLLDILVRMTEKMTHHSHNQKVLPCNYLLHSNITMQIKDGDEYKDCTVHAYNNNEYIGSVYYDQKHGKIERLYVKTGEGYTLEGRDEKKYRIKCNLIHNSPRCELGKIDEPIEEFEEYYLKSNDRYEFEQCRLYGWDETIQEERLYGFGHVKKTSDGHQIASIQNTLDTLVGSAEAKIMLNDGTNTLYGPDQYFDREARLVRKENNVVETLNSGTIDFGIMYFPVLCCGEIQCPVFECTLLKQYFFKQPVKENTPIQASTEEGSSYASQRIQQLEQMLMQQQQLQMQQMQAMMQRLNIEYNPRQIPHQQNYNIGNPGVTYNPSQIPHQQNYNIGNPGVTDYPNRTAHHPSPNILQTDGGATPVTGIPGQDMNLLQNNSGQHSRGDHEVPTVTESIVFPTIRVDARYSPATTQPLSRT